MENVKKTSQLVFDPRVARQLCKKNFHIIDIKPLRNEPEKTVFVFENTVEFQAAFTQIMEEIKAKADAKKEVEAE